MPLIQLIEILIVVSVVMRLVNRFIPMRRTTKSIHDAALVISIVPWLLNVSGLPYSFSKFKVGS